MKASRLQKELEEFREVQREQYERWRRYRSYRQQLEDAFPSLVDPFLEPEAGLDDRTIDQYRYYCKIQDDLEYKIMARLSQMALVDEKVVSTESKAKALIPAAEALSLIKRLGIAAQIAADPRKIPKLIQDVQAIEADFLARNPGLVPLKALVDDNIN